MLRRRLLAFLLGLVFSSCRDEECPPGTEGCPCAEDNACEANLVCTNNATTLSDVENTPWVCEAPAEGSGSEGSGSDGSSSEGSTSEGPAALPCEIGISECDTYVARYVECIDEKLPDEVKETSYKALLTSCEAWVEAAQDPSKHDELADACVSAWNAVRESCGF